MLDILLTIAFIVIVGLIGVGMFFKKRDERERENLQLENARTEKAEREAKAS